MSNSATLVASPATIAWNKVKTFFSKPYNVILLLLGIVLTVTTVAPIIAIVQDTFKIHAGTIDAHLTKQTSGWTIVNYTDLFTSKLARTNLWKPLWNTVLLSVGTCVVSILYGGIFAFLITRTNLAWRQYLSSIFIFPYIMPQWTLAVVWQNLFYSTKITGTSDGLLASLFHIYMPKWFCQGLFPSLMVLGLHYAPFAYILIGGIFRNMDANLEEAATILDTPKHRIMFRITLPMVKPAILSTILLVFGSAMGSYPVPHYMQLTTLSTKYVSMNSKYTGEASILAIIMMVFGIAIMLLNQLSLTSRKSYTTVTGKSGQISKINLGAAKYIIAIILVILTFFTSIFPIISFAFETFLPNPGDYSFLYTGDTSNLTTKWWLTSENPIQRRDLEGLRRHTVGQRLLRPGGRHDRHACRLRRGQAAAQQVGQLCQLRRLPAVSDAVHRRRRGAVRALFQRIGQAVQHLHRPDRRRYDQVYPLRKPLVAQLDAAAFGRDRGGGDHPGCPVDPPHDPHHHSHPEIVDHQRLSAAVHDLPA